MSNNWDKKFLKMALDIASWSKDTSTKVGAVITGPDREIRSTGYNGMPRLVNDNKLERYDRPQKYMWFEHAERNAIYNAARMGTPLAGCTLYITSFPLKFPPCADCARGIIQAGIIRVVQEPPVGDASRWKESTDCTMAMFFEAGIQFDICQL